MIVEIAVKVALTGLIFGVDVLGEHKLLISFNVLR
jgi:hypothetical protein